MKIAFDLDGVLRSLFPIVKERFNLTTPYDYGQWEREGHDIYELVAKDYSLLEKAKPTKYIGIIQEYYKKCNNYIEIWSYQPYEWVQYTNRWIEKYFPVFGAYWLMPKEKFERLSKNKDYILIDDYPNHKNYHQRLWLIDQPYNQNVKCEVRIKTVNDLREKLLEINK